MITYLRTNRRLLVLLGVLMILVLATTFSARGAPDGARARGPARGLGAQPWNSGRLPDDQNSSISHYDAFDKFPDLGTRAEAAESPMTIQAIVVGLITSLLLFAVYLLGKEKRAL